MHENTVILIGSVAGVRKAGKVTFLRIKVDQIDGFGKGTFTVKCFGELSDIAETLQVGSEIRVRGHLRNEEYPKGSGKWSLIVNPELIAEDGEPSLGDNSASVKDSESKFGW